MALNYAKTNTFSTGTTIASSAVNANFDDPVNAFAGLENLSKSLANLLIDTTLRSSGTIQYADGTALLPSLCFTADTTTGIYRIGTGDLAIATSATKRFEISTTAITSTLPLAMGTNKITGLANGTATTDAVALGQMIYMSSPSQTVVTSNFATTSSTFQSTNLSASITPSSATSRIKITVSGELTANAATGISGFLSIFRGSTNLAVGGNADFARVRSAAAQQNVVPVFVAFIDSPATTSLTTYTIKLKNSDNANIVEFGQAEDQILILEEVHA